LTSLGIGTSLRSQNAQARATRPLFDTRYQ
jgi:hypothetical protein